MFRSTRRLAALVALAPVLALGAVGAFVFVAAAPAAAHTAGITITCQSIQVDFTNFPSGSNSATVVINGVDTIVSWTGSSHTFTTSRSPGGKVTVSAHWTADGGGSAGPVTDNGNGCGGGEGNCGHDSGNGSGGSDQGYGHDHDHCTTTTTAAPTTTTTAKPTTTTAAPTTTSTTKPPCSSTTTQEDVALAFVAECPTTTTAPPETTTVPRIVGCIGPPVACNPQPTTTEPLPTTTVPPTTAPPTTTAPPVAVLPPAAPASCPEGSHNPSCLAFTGPSQSTIVLAIAGLVLVVLGTVALALGWRRSAAS